jgi:hypothetical protein
MKKIITAIAGITSVLFFVYSMMDCQSNRGRDLSDDKYI